MTVAAEDDASAPTVTVSDASGAEDMPIALDITAALTDMDGSEEISSITLSGIPAGATLNHGTLDEVTGDWSVELSDLVDLEVTPAPNSNEDFQITVSVTSTESNGGATATTTATLDVDVSGVVDDFTVATQDAAGQSGTELPLDISVDLTDLDGSETVSVTLTGIPEGATLNHGTFDEGSGNWTLSPSIPRTSTTRSTARRRPGATMDSRRRAAAGAMTTAPRRTTTGSNSRTRRAVTFPPSPLRPSTSRARKMFPSPST